MSEANQLTLYIETPLRNTINLIKQMLDILSKTIQDNNNWCTKRKSNFIEQYALIEWTHHTKIWIFKSDIDFLNNAEAVSLRIKTVKLNEAEIDFNCIDKLETNNYNVFTVAVNFIFDYYKK